MSVELRVGDYVRQTKGLSGHMGPIVKVNRKTVWLEGYFMLEEMWNIADLVLLEWNEKINCWQDA